MRAHQVLRRRRIGYSALSVVVVAAVGFGALQFTKDDSKDRGTLPAGTPGNSASETPSSPQPTAALRVMPENPVEGDEIKVVVENTGTDRVSYGEEYKLEHQVDEGWEDITGVDAWIDIGYEAAPGKSGPAQTIRNSLPAGTYRITKPVSAFDDASGSYMDKTELTAEFTVAPSSEPTPPPPIEVAAPMPGDRVESPVLVWGTADVYEATVSIRIRDSRGEIIAETFTTATCGSGCRGDYSKRVKYEVEEAQGGTVEVYSVSAENGKPMHLVEIPVVLNP